MIVGVVVTFLAVPQILNFLFPSETIEVGETFEDGKLAIRVEAVTRGEFLTGEFGYAVTLAVDAESSWRPPRENFVLVLEDGAEIKASNLDAGATSEDRERIPQGESTLTLEFPAGFDAELAVPESLHLEEPPVKFELPAPVTP